MTEPTATPAGTRELAEAVRRLATAQTAHGIRAVALELEERDGRPLVRGTVLTQRQARDVRDLARKHGVTAELVVAADPRSGMEDGWVAPAGAILDLWREPSRRGDEAGRQTQYLASDGPLRRFGEEDGFILLQGPDLAMGWAAATEVIDVVPAGGSHPWSHVARAQENVARRPASSATDSDGVLERARRELGVRYVWGGTTHAGFDCSGLVQRVFLEATGVLMPRHTGDQRRVGARVVAGGARAGDLLFAAPRAQKVGHVVLMTSANTVLHACRTENRVIEETIEQNAARYLHQGWRRPVWLGQPPE